MTLERIELSRQQKIHTSKKSPATLTTVTLKSKSQIPKESSQNLQKICLETLPTISTCSTPKTIKQEKKCDDLQEKRQVKQPEKKEQKKSVVKEEKVVYEKRPQTRQNAPRMDFDKRDEELGAEDKNKLKTANTKPMEIQKKQTNKKKPRTYQELEFNGFSQDLFGFVKELYGGLIVTTNNRYICIMEIIPSNFDEKSLYEKQSILENYQRMLTIAPRSGHLKCITQVTDSSDIINNLRKASSGMESEKRQNIRRNHIAHIKKISQKNTIHFRYFYIFEYEGNNFGIKATEKEQIYEEMEGKKRVYQQILEEGNNYVATPEDPNMYTLEILYLLLNRNSYQTESLASRILRINHDYSMMGVEPDLASYFAPKGITFNYSKESHTSDGMYFTYLSVLDSAYPDKISPCWLNQIRAGTVNMDIDFFQDKQPYETTKRRSEKKKVWNVVSAKQTRNVSRQESYIEKAKAAHFIEESMKAGNDLFECCTVITLYGYDQKKLLQQRDDLQKEYQSAHFYTEGSYMDTEEYYTMTLPFLNFRNRIFKKNKRNMTTSTLKNSYCFSNYSLFDQTYPSVVIGPSLDHGTMYAMNRFNTNYYANPHITIIGTSGSGKTFLEMGIGRRDVLMNLKTYYILPLKAFEYEEHCQSLEGEYIQFGNQAEKIYNIMELFPVKEGKYQASGIKKTSVLNQKINSLCTWLRILSALNRDEKYRMSIMDINRIQQVLYDLYNDFGFTDDNDSIWEDKERGIKKDMPIISYWEERMRENGNVEVFADLLLPFTRGRFANYNQQSTINYDNDVMICNVEKDDIGEDLLPAIMYLAFDLINGRIKADRTTLSSFFLDEAWYMMITEIVGKLIEEDIRVLRGYGCSVVCASQQIEEFTSNKYGRAVISNSAIKILMQMEPQEVDSVSEVIPLTFSDKKFLTSCKAGEMLIISKLYKFKCMLEVSLEEAIIYNTDPLKKEELRKKLEMEKGM